MENKRKQDKQLQFSDLIKEHIDVNKRIASNEKAPIREREKARKKLSRYMQLLGELYRD